MASGALVPFVRSATANETLQKTAPDPGKLSKVISADSFELQDGRLVRLAGLDAPSPPMGLSKGQPLWQEAQDHLRQILEGKELSFIDNAPDRFGRVRGHVLVGSQKLWVQGEMLTLGMARVRTWADAYSKAQPMLTLEMAARQNNKGIWQHQFYQVRTPKDLADTIGSFQIVEGKIIDATSGRTHTYLNFGSDWRQDFTAQASKRVTRVFAKTGIDLARLTGVKVRVRGLIKPKNGTLIELGHPSQLERLP